MPTNGPTPEQELTEVAAGMAERLKHIRARTRFELLGLLVGGPKDVTTLAERAELDVVSVSRHLSGLRSDGLVTCIQQRSRRIHALSRSVRVETRADQVELRVATATTAQVAFAFPLPLIRRLHPVWPAIEPAALKPSRKVDRAKGKSGAAAK